MKECLSKLSGWIPALLILSILQSCKSGDQNFPDSKRAMVLWYKQPVVQWHEGMPIGNGYMGAMVFGRIQHERIAINESTFWSGKPHDYNDPQAHRYFEKIKELVLKVKLRKREEREMKLLMEKHKEKQANKQ